MARMMDINELSEYLHLKKSTIYKRTSTNQIPHFKMGKNLLFDPDEINSWLGEYRQPTQRELQNDVNQIIKLKNQKRNER